MHQEDCGKQEKTMEFFLSNTQKEAYDAYEDLFEINGTRKEITEDVYNQAKEKINKNRLYEKNILFVEDENWHMGILGIVAARLVAEYNKPAIVCSLEDGVIKGSGRSIIGLDLYEELNKIKDKVEFQFGGHSQAIGISVDKDNKEKLETILENEITNIEKQESTIYYDLELPYMYINSSMYEEMEKLQPFGEGNESVVFLFKNLKIADIQEYTKIIKFEFIKKDKKVVGLTFDIDKFKNIKPTLKKGDIINVLASLNKNVFRGKATIQLDIIDYKRIGDLS